MIYFERVYGCVHFTICRCRDTVFQMGIVRIQDVWVGEFTVANLQFQIWVLKQKND